MKSLFLHTKTSLIFLPTVYRYNFWRYCAEKPVLISSGFDRVIWNIGKKKIFFYTILNNKVVWYTSTKSGCNFILTMHARQLRNDGVLLKKKIFGRY